MYRTCIEHLNKFRSIILPIVPIYGKHVSRVQWRASSSSNHHDLKPDETRWPHENIPTLKEFMQRQLDESTLSSHGSSLEAEMVTSSLTNYSVSKDQKVFVEIYGCQMNVNDAGKSYTRYWTPRDIDEHNMSMMRILYCL